MVYGTVVTRCCTWCDVCLMGGRTGMWPTTSTYTGEFCSPICYPFWLTASLRTGLTARGASCLAPRRLRTAGLPDPIAQEGPPRIEQASTPITPAGYGGGANPAHRVQVEEMGCAQKEGSAGAVGKSSQQQMECHQEFIPLKSSLVLLNLPFSSQGSSQHGDQHSWANNTGRMLDA